MFSNGSEYMNFIDCFCDRCQKQKVDKKGKHLRNNCKIETAMAMAQFDKDKFPEEYLVACECFYFCPYFVGLNRKIDAQYQAECEKRSIERKNEFKERIRGIRKIKGQIEMEGEENGD